MSTSNPATIQLSIFSGSTGNSGDHDDSKMDDDEMGRKGATWRAMPGKKQLTLIVLARLVDAIAAGSIQSYILFQLQSFPLPDGSPPDTATVALHLSILRASFGVAQLLTSTLWGALADHPRVGRKSVIIMSLAASGIGSIGLGLARSFPAALVWRLFVGLASSNIPAMKSIIRQTSGKKFESRAVLLLPAACNVGSVLGPLMGGFLADRAVRTGRTAGGHSSLPSFWVPNTVNAAVQLCIVPLLLWQLRDVPLGNDNHRPRKLVSIVPAWATHLLRRYILRQPRYEQVTNQPHDDDESEQGLLLPDDRSKIPERVSFWTRRMTLTLVARMLIIIHTATYPSLLIVFASTPRYNPSDRNKAVRGHTLDMKRVVTNTMGIEAESGAVHAARSAPPSLPIPPGYHPSGPLVFTGGLGFSPHDLAFALAFRGFVALVLQLLLFPKLRDMFGTLRLYRYAVVVFPVTYFLTPYLAIVPSSTSPPLRASGFSLWATMLAILSVQSTARSMVLPASEMLLNAASPDRSLLSTVHGISRSGAAASRIAGQVLLTGWLYGVGLEHGVVGAAWWGMAAVAALGAAAAACLPPL